MRCYCLKPVITAGIILVFFNGCGEAVPKARHGNRSVMPSVPQISASEGLTGQMEFGLPTVHRGAYEPLSVAIPVRAAHNQPQRVQYRFEYFDDSGRPIRPTMDWRYILLPVQGERVMASSALDTAAVDWRLEIRRAKRN